MVHRLSDNDTNLLRSQGIISELEIVSREGDVLIAEHILTHVRRVINTSGLLLESDKKILLD